MLFHVILSTIYTVTCRPTFQQIQRKFDSITAMWMLQLKKHLAWWYISNIICHTKTFKMVNSSSKERFKQRKFRNIATPNGENSLFLGYPAAGMTSIFCTRLHHFLKLFFKCNSVRTQGLNNKPCKPCNFNCFCAFLSLFYSAGLWTSQIS